MSRDIKFRAWDGKQFWYWGIGDINGDGSTCSFPSGAIAVMPQGQYTGLHDKNGVEIYEGDILVLSKLKRSYYVVEYDKSAFILNGVTILKESPYFTEREVIGNIYENPELLKTKE